MVVVDELYDQVELLAAVQRVLAAVGQVVDFVVFDFVHVAYAQLVLIVRLGVGVDAQKEFAVDETRHGEQFVRLRAIDVLDKPWLL